MCQEALRIILWGHRGKRQRQDCLDRFKKVTGAWGEEERRRWKNGRHAIKLDDILRAWPGYHEDGLLKLDETEEAWRLVPPSRLRGWRSQVVPRRTLSDRHLRQDGKEKSTGHALKRCIRSNRPRYRRRRGQCQHLDRARWEAASAPRKRIALIKAADNRL